MTKLKVISSAVTKDVEFRKEDSCARVYWVDGEAQTVIIASGKRVYEIDFDTAKFIKESVDAGILTCPQDGDQEHPRETGWLHTDGH